MSPQSIDRDGGKRRGRFYKAVIWNTELEALIGEWQQRVRRQISEKPEFNGKFGTGNALSLSRRLPGTNGNLVKQTAKVLR